MEFGNLGQYCSAGGCGQQDFLPFECDGCHKIFCTAHARAPDHACPLPADYDSVVVIICPICEARIKLKKADDPNEAWHAHSGACVPKSQQSGKQTKKCLAQKCYARLTDINSVQCPMCLKDVCLRHRFEDDHQCTHIVEPIRNKQTAKSKLLQPGYFKEQQSVINQDQLTSLERNIAQFSLPAVAQKPEGSSYQPERCELCGALFIKQDEFISHVSGHFDHQAAPPKKTTETQKCPHCPLRFAITELPSHLQLEHFIF